MAARGSWRADRACLRHGGRRWRSGSDWRRVEGVWVDCQYLGCAGQGVGRNLARHPQRRAYPGILVPGGDNCCLRLSTCGVHTYCTYV